MEHVKDIHKIKNLGIDDSLDMAINCEWVSKQRLFLDMTLLSLARIMVLVGRI